MRFTEHQQARRTLQDIDTDAGGVIAWWDNFLSENHVFYRGTITVLNPNNNVKAEVRARNCPTWGQSNPNR